MKYFDLDKDEKKILKDVEAGNYVRVKNFKKAKRVAVQIAQNTLNKTKNINIRLTEKVLHKLKTKAAEEGIPYQTLASSVLHKYVNR